MVGYDPWHWQQQEDQMAKLRRFFERQAGVTVKVLQPATTPEREALTDIAYDCGTLDAAQKRAREALSRGLPAPACPRAQGPFLRPKEQR